MSNQIFEFVIPEPGASVSEPSKDSPPVISEFAQQKFLETSNIKDLLLENIRTTGLGNPAKINIYALEVLKTYHNRNLKIRTSSRHKFLSNLKYESLTAELELKLILATPSIRDNDDLRKHMLYLRNNGIPKMAYVNMEKSNKCIQQIDASKKLQKLKTESNSHQIKDPCLPRFNANIGISDFAVEKFIEYSNIKELLWEDIIMNGKGTLNHINNYAQKILYNYLMRNIGSYFGKKKSILENLKFKSIAEELLIKWLAAHPDITNESELANHQKILEMHNVNKTAYINLSKNNIALHFELKAVNQLKLDYPNSWNNKIASIPVLLLRKYNKEHSQSRSTNFNMPALSTEDGQMKATTSKPEDSVSMIKVINDMNDRSVITCEDKGMSNEIITIDYASDAADLIDELCQED